jgi:hypothetical protein
MAVDFLNCRGDETQRKLEIDSKPLWWRPKPKSRSFASWAKHGALPSVGEMLCADVQK